MKFTKEEIIEWLSICIEDGSQRDRQIYQLLKVLIKNMPENALNVALEIIHNMSKEQS